MSKHLTIHQGTHFQDLPINTKYQLVECYLSQINNVLHRAVEEHPRTIAFHAVLRFPLDSHSVQHRVDCISRFIESFKAQVEANRKKKQRAEHRVHKTAVRYVWCREQSSSENEHYHIFILMNGDTYRSMGDYENPKSGQLFYMLNSAWGRAIDIDTQLIRGLVHLPGPMMNVNTKTDSSLVKYDQYIGSNASSFASVFHWMSYLAKYETKQYGIGWRNFGCSQR